MPPFDRVTAMIVVVVALAGAAMIVSRLVETPETEAIDVDMPALSTVATEGRDLFDSNCAQCHGQNGAGSDQGPPLIHVIYNPGHHADLAFVLAAQNGVAQHHWRFGTMPPQPQVSRQDIEKIVRFVREVQEANGITYEEHTM